jgi:endoglucanase
MYKLLNKTRLTFLITVLVITNTVLSYSTTFSKNDTNVLENDSTVVERFGQLQVQGNKIVDKNGNPVALRGMSLFWSQWMGKYYNYSCLEWLRDDWECTVVRAAMGVEQGGYLQNPIAEKNKVLAVIDACIDLGIYVIIDWHDHNAQNHQAEALAFFTEIADLYGSYPNIIYEIYNEPLQVSWTEVIKPYAEAVIETIRSIDPDNLIIVGTPTWSQNVDVASQNPIEYDNIAYALHFYAATHKQWLRNKATIALNNGIALFVSEWGTCEASGDGIIDSVEVESWLNFMDENKLSWCNWSIADKNETSAALRSGADQSGYWQDSDLTESGSLVKDKIKSSNDSLSTGIGSLNVPLIDFELYQNYPNPFNPETKIKFTLPDVGTRYAVSLRIYDILEQEVATLINEEKPAGTYEITFSTKGRSASGGDAFSLSSGIYFYMLTAGDFVKTKKMILIK